MNKRERYYWLLNWYDTKKSELNTLSDLVSAIKGDSQVEATIRSLYLELFNKSVSGCGNCLADAFAELRHFPAEKIDAIMDCRFKLHSGVLLMDTRNILPFVTSANITDELAIAYLKDNPARISLFDEVPENLDELLADTAVSGAEQVTDGELSEEAIESAETPKKSNRRGK